MPYYKEPNILFIHIPKTGGRVIEHELARRYNPSVMCRQIKLEPPYNKITLQHQYYTTLYKFKNKLKINFDNIKIFSIVRNPYDRVISDLFHFKKIGINFTSEQVCHVIKNNYLYNDFASLDNHNCPQYKYITDENGELIKNIKLFKTETLDESNDELNNFMGFNINIKLKEFIANMDPTRADLFINKARISDYSKSDYSKYLNEESISLINNFYKKDFELFNYELK